MRSIKLYLRRFFTNKHGQVVWWQAPNWPIIIWAATTLLSDFTHGTPTRTFGLIAYGALFTWAWLETTRGASYFRRTLGVVVLVLAIQSRL